MEDGAVETVADPRLLETPARDVVMHAHRAMMSRRVHGCTSVQSERMGGAAARAAAKEAAAAGTATRVTPLHMAGGSEGGGSETMR